MTSLPRRFLRSLCVYGVIIAVSLLASVLLCEVYIRLTLMKKIPERIDGAAMWIQNHALIKSAVDDYFGRTIVMHPRGLFKTNTTIDIAVAYPKFGILNFSVRTNNVGLLSEHHYILERDPANPEYRIAVLGDSMTGTSTATYQWVDTIEQLLNSSSTLRAKVGGKKFAVYNFGWIGAGFNSFWLEYERSARYFSPDLVVLNYIDIDFPRAALRNLTDDSEMIEHAAYHLRKILAEHPNTIVALMPIYGELMAGKPEVVLTERLMKAMPGLKVEIMLNRMPTHLGKDEIEKWYNLPHDAHLSDRGGEIYARALAGWIAENITANHHDFFKTPTKHWNLDPNAPRTRKIQNSLSYIADYPDVIATIKRKILDEEMRGKVYSLYSYFYRLPVTGSDGLTIPYSRPMRGGVEKIPFGAGHDDVVYLSLACVSPPVSLRNAECYHFQHVFVK